MPLYGIRADITPSFDITKILDGKNTDFRYYLSTISLLEIKYLLNGAYRKNGDTEILHRYEHVSPTLLRSPHITIIDSLLNMEINHIADLIRATGHTDMLDCLIAATAVDLNGILLTEDKKLKKSLSATDFQLEFSSWSQFYKHNKHILG